MGRFLLQVLAAFLGGLFLLFFFFILAIGLGAALSKTEKVAVEPGSYLNLDLNGWVLADRSVEEDPFSELNSLFGEEERMGLNRILRAIERAQADPDISGIYLDLGGFSGGMASVREIREALDEFKRISGKPIVAYGTFVSTKSLYLASAADSLFLNPHGALEWSGLNMEVSYLKDGLDKLGVKVDLIRGSNNRFKSAGEPFIANRMSDANRAQLQQLADELWGEVISAVAGSRSLNPEDLQRWADSLSISEAQSVLEHKLVDGLLEEDEIDARLVQRTGAEEGKKAHTIGIGSYLKSPLPEGAPKPSIKSDKIAVVYAEGEFNEGDGAYNIQSDRMISALRTVRKDKKVKAVVLRVNSPGGFAFAADKICRELSLFDDSIPVVVSMGDVAASAGYMISAMGDSVFAHPNSITGSIGVFGMLIDGSELLEDKLGIRNEQIKTAAHSGAGSFSRGLDPFERKVIQREIDRYYNDFVQHVADERGMTFAEVDSVAQGRVWTGNSALGIGLIDALGGLRRAESCAARMAGLEKGSYRVVEYPEIEDPIQQLLNKLEGKSSRWSKDLPASIQHWLTTYQQMVRYNRMPLYRLEQELLL
ncbi:signal peptide peptidase SppA [bacterium]|nr:signal peptide peptidase SppA [bacterium]